MLEEAEPMRAALAVLTIPDALEAGKVVTHLKQSERSISVLARAHGEDEARHLMARGADAALLAEQALAHSLAEMIAAAPPYRTKPLR